MCYLLIEQGKLLFISICFSKYNTQDVYFYFQEFNECKNKKEAILSEIQTLQEGIKNCENAPNTNTLRNNEICKIKDSNNKKAQSLLERQNSVEKNIREQSQLKDMYNDRQANIHELKNKLKESLNYQNELRSKLEKDRINHQLER